MNNAGVLVKDDEIDRYEHSVQSFLNHQMEGDRFMSARLQQGVYGQRQEGVNMIRVKIPGGAMTAAHVSVLADVLERHVRHDVIHITTRQDFQIHYVPLEDTPAVLRDLAAAGLTTREACGNTVRNVTACPMTGVCAREHVDVTPLLDGAVAHFLRHPLTQHLPRKFKISFSGCEDDCAQGMMHDLGVVARKKDGRFGFRVLAGGGLGHKPREAIVVEDFIEEKDLLPSMEAIISLHHRYSDRVKRAKARIKFLVDRFGAEGFVEKYQEEYARTRAAFEGRPYPTGVWKEGTGGESCGMGAPRQVFAQKQAGLHVFPISVPIGDITAPQLRAIAVLMEQEGLDEIRTTQDQNLILINVPAARIDAVRAALAQVGLTEPTIGDDVVACPGTSTCRLGITSSKIVGTKLTGSVADLRIRVSGCHNGCAQPETGDIGIYGEGNRVNGKLIPHYQMYFGGDGRAGGGLGFKGPSIPSARIEVAVARVQQTYLADREAGESFYLWTRRRGKESFTTLLADLKVVTPDEMPLVLNDHGDVAAFKVLQLGGGECAGAAQELVASSFSEAAYERSCRNAFVQQHKQHEALECAEAIVRLIGQSLLFMFGHSKVDDNAEVVRLLKEFQPDNPHLGERLEHIAQQLTNLQDHSDEVALAQLMSDLDAWTLDAGKLCESMDKQLDLASSLPGVSGQAQSRPTGNGIKPAAHVRGRTVDLSTFGCPLHYMKARLELGTIPADEVIDFLLQSGEAVTQVSSSLTEDGHSILASIEEGGNTRITVRK